ncbi:hypothetical protein CCYA_CCYA02G0463 [Cyanidiococcus yangmingshanensis]|nr:hypothetical protein CCYA_CCYA02G0463 [Cyanidiococcus yangmingshanensis]
MNRRSLLCCLFQGPVEQVPSPVPAPAQRLEELFRGLRRSVRRECQRLIADRSNEHASQAFQVRVEELLSQMLQGSMLAGRARLTAQQCHASMSRYLQLDLGQKQALLVHLERFAEHFERYPTLGMTGFRGSNSPLPAAMLHNSRKRTATPDSNPTGTKPNLAYRAILREHLREHPRHVALPPVETLVIESVRDLTRIPQDSALWLEARRHMQVNASSAWKVLGFCEPMTLEWLRDCVPSWQLRRGHEETVQAWRLARDPHLSESFPENVHLSMDWGKNHEQNGLLTVLRYLESHLTTSSASAEPTRQELGAEALNQDEALHLFESGLHVLQPEACAGVYDLDDFPELPTIAASPDAFICRGRQGPPSMNELTDAICLESSEGAFKSFELVEVKCPCPFVPVESTAFDVSPLASSTAPVLYRYRSVLPQKLVHANHFAQVQLQMLCTDTWRAHFISWTPDAGARLFILDRDEAWLEMALIALRDFYREFVREPPPENFFADRNTYRHLLELTVAGVQQSKEHSVTLSADQVRRLLAWETQAGFLNLAGPLFLD